MRWDQLLDALERDGHRAEELDFMENYGPIVRGEHPALEGRHVRCVFGAARLDDLGRFDAYLFPSPEDAGEFYHLIGTPPEWIRIENMVVRSEPAAAARLRNLLQRTLSVRAEGQ